MWCAGHVADALSLTDVDYHQHLPKLHDKLWTYERTSESYSRCHIKVSTHEKSALGEIITELICLFRRPKKNSVLPVAVRP